MNYPKIAAANIGDFVGFLVDGNDDTFTGSKDLQYIFDFGENFRVLPSM